MTKTKATPEFPEGTFAPSVLVNHQVKTYGPKAFTYYGQRCQIKAKVRFDDSCNNGHNSFAITGEIYIPGKSDCEACGCLHEEIAKAFPELAPFIKWHLTSTDYPLHYFANTVYHAGDRDHWGLKKGEFRQHLSRGPNQADGVEGVPHWELMPGDTANRYAKEKPAPVTLEWRPSGVNGVGKAREFAHARAAAVWPEATEEQLSLEPDQLRALLAARLPALMADFKKAVESLGFVY